MWKKIVAGVGGLFGLVMSIVLYRKGYNHGKKRGEATVRKEHEAIITKIEEKEEKKHGITQENVVDRLNDRFH